MCHTLEVWHIWGIWGGESIGVQHFFSVGTPSVTWENNASIGVPHRKKVWHTCLHLLTEFS